MKDTTIPIQNPEFRLQKQGDEFQLLNVGQQSSIFINDTAALIWEMCSEDRSLGDIKAALKEAYPETLDEIDQGVDSAIEMLASHNAIEVTLA